MINRPINASLEDRNSVYAFALAGLARLASSCETLDDNLRIRLGQYAVQRFGTRPSLLAAVEEYLEHPAEEDDPLNGLAARFQLSTIEILAVRLAMAAEHDLLVGHLLTHLQQPLAAGRPTIGLAAQAYAPGDLSKAVHQLGQGNAIRCGLLEICGDDAPLAERALRIPLPTALALQDMDSFWPGTSPIAFDQYPVPLGRTASAHAEMLASRLYAADAAHPALVIRSGDPLEARAAAAEVCTSCSTRAVLIQTDQLAGIAPWLLLKGLLPVFSHWLMPGERKPVPAIPGYPGPVIVLAGPEGEFESTERTVLDWRLETPPVQERAELWRAAVGDQALSNRLAIEHRHSAGRIAALAARAREEAGPGAPLTFETIRAVSRRGESAGLGTLAELITGDVDESALVLTDSLRQELEALVARCRLREQFPDSLGPSIQARYRPSVRALFVGPSGTGKTLAVSWIATRLGIPLFRVDLSAVTSKYIGETEKNLSQLLARAEQNEVLLLFDEADALFGKRTDIQDANDRFANAQTNYLLQRMESYDGITILTSNGRSRFDEAFSRRFDAILSFPLPSPEERRSLWLAHLGADHALTQAQLNRMAAVAELTGGQIRNAVLRGAVDAAQHGEAIGFSHLLTGVASEYRKLSRQLPNELKLAEVVR